MKETESKPGTPDTIETEESAPASQGTMKKISKVVTALAVAAPMLMGPATASAETLNQLAFLREAASSNLSVEHPILQEAIIEAQKAPGESELRQEYGQTYGQTYNQTYNQTYTESYTQAHTADEAEES